MKRYDTAYANVVDVTSKGVIVDTDFGGQAKIYGNFVQGDRLLVSLKKRLSGELDVVLVESVIEYAPRESAA